MSMPLNNPNEIIGNIYNDMKVVEYVKTNKNFVKIYKVICLKCGKIKNIEYARLNKKESGTLHSNKSCGVYLKEYDNNIGLTINDYIIIKLDAITKHGYRYITKCNICGMEHSNLLSNFNRGYSTKHSECPLHITKNRYMKRFKKNMGLYETTNNKSKV
jgi:transcription elongation factor Elf1